MLHHDLPRPGAGYSRLPFAKPSCVRSILPGKLPARAGGCYILPLEINECPVYDTVAENARGCWLRCRRAAPAALVERPELFSSPPPKQVSRSRRRGRVPPCSCHGQALRSRFAGMRY
jgi:hypothetical protein